jgi:hypothetical protein
VHLSPAVVPVTPGEFAYATALNEYGCDSEDASEHDVLRCLRIHSHDGQTVPSVQSTNWPATLAAVAARGPRCASCNDWTFRQALWTGKPHTLLCTPCEDELRALCTGFTEGRAW